MFKEKSKAEEKEEIFEIKNTDVIIYNSDITREGANKIYQLVETTYSDSVTLMLSTSGGDAHAAYKIAKCLQQKYKKFYLYVNTFCKSAGTLIALGSDQIIMTNNAEFGPLDVQLREKDELVVYSSGLNIAESMITIKNEALNVFRDTLIELANNRISTKTAAELATELAIGFISPIVSQINPIKLGEIQRATKIALAYGERLGLNGRGNVKSSEELIRLIQEYPDHGFVIDHNEAYDIFKKVRISTPEEDLFLRDLENKTENAHNYIQRLHINKGNENELNKQKSNTGTRENEGKTTSINKENNTESEQISREMETIS